MDCSCNNQMTVVSPGSGDEMNASQLLEALSAQRASQLVFHWNGHDIASGYHVTEVKVGQFSGLDCGANPEAWTEIFIQLLDQPAGAGHMSASKFLSIIGKVVEHVQLDMNAKLTFEISNGVEPIQLMRAHRPVAAGKTVRVELSSRPASCKPRDRWLTEAPREASKCCGSSASPCCAA